MTETEKCVRCGGKCERYGNICDHEQAYYWRYFQTDRIDIGTYCEDLDDKEPCENNKFRLFVPREFLDYMMQNIDTQSGGTYVVDPQTQEFIRYVHQ